MQSPPPSEIGPYFWVLSQKFVRISENKITGLWNFKKITVQTQTLIQQKLVVVIASVRHNIDPVR